MSTNTVDNKRKVTTRRLVEMKQRGEKISMLTAYDYWSAKIIDAAGVDCILVGDSASNVMAGNVTLSWSWICHSARIRAIPRRLLRLPSAS